MLEHIKIKLNAKDWNFMYKLAKKYYEHNNDLEVPHLFKTLNGYENTNIKESYYLGNWIVEQRRLYSNGKLSQDKIKLLKDIGIRFEVKDYEAKWQEMYNLAKAYKEHYGNVEIVCSFKTVNPRHHFNLPVRFVFTAAEIHSVNSITPFFGSQRLNTM